jgi:hypothetical protein
MKRRQKTGNEGIIFKNGDQARIRRVDLNWRFMNQKMVLQASSRGTVRYLTQSQNYVLAIAEIFCSSAETVFHESGLVHVR